MRAAGKPRQHPLKEIKKEKAVSHSPLITIIAMLVFVGMCAKSFSMDATHLAMSGRNLTAGEAKSLEKQIKENEQDVKSRTIILGYYFGKQFQNPSASEAIENHVLWLIRNAPESEVLSTHFGCFHADLNPEAYSQGKEAWEDQLEKKPANLKLLENSAQFFLQHDKDIAIQSFQKLKVLDKNNPEWSRHLGHLYLREMGLTSSESDGKMALKALEQLELAYGLSNGEGKDALLDSLAKAALAANRTEKAKEYAEIMLSQNAPGWNYGNNIHHGNLILGRIALALDDIEEAKVRLIKAGNTPGSPQLDSFGPNMTLAKELLQKGEKEVVIEYLELCSKFWKMGKDRLEEWPVIINDDRIPDFGGNLRY